MQAVLSKRLISQEIDDILAKVLGKFLVQGSPTKHGGLRFLDIQSAKTFGFENTQAVDDGNLLILSAPAGRDRQDQLEAAIRKGPHADRLRSVVVRASKDQGKKAKTFVEVGYFIPTEQLISDQAIIDYAKKHEMTNTSEALRRILREYIIPMAKEVMDHLILVVREEK